MLHPLLMSVLFQCPWLEDAFFWVGYFHLTQLPIGVLEVAAERDKESMFSSSVWSDDIFITRQKTVSDSVDSYAMSCGNLVNFLPKLFNISEILIQYIGVVSYERQAVPAWPRPSVSPGRVITLYVERKPLLYKYRIKL